MIHDPYLTMAVDQQIRRMIVAMTKHAPAGRQLGGDIVQLAESAATIAPLLMPRRISRVLLSRVKPTAEGSGLLVNASKFEPLIVEVPETSQKPDREGGREEARAAPQAKSA